LQIAPTAALPRSSHARGGRHRSCGRLPHLSPAAFPARPKLRQPRPLITGSNKARRRKYTTDHGVVEIIKRHNAAILHMVTPPGHVPTLVQLGFATTKPARTPPNPSNNGSADRFIMNWLASIIQSELPPWPTFQRLECYACTTPISGRLTARAAYLHRRCWRIAAGAVEPAPQDGLERRLVGLIRRTRPRVVLIAAYRPGLRSPARPWPLTIDLAVHPQFSAAGACVSYAAIASLSLLMWAAGRRQGPQSGAARDIPDRCAVCGCAISTRGLPV
jgi:hypothetical protein